MLGWLSCRRNGRARLSAAGEIHLRSELEREIGVFLFGKKILPGNVWKAIVDEGTSERHIAVVRAGLGRARERLGWWDTRRLRKGKTIFLEEHGLDDSGWRHARSGSSVLRNRDQDGPVPGRRDQQREWEALPSRRTALLAVFDMAVLLSRAPSGGHPISTRRSLAGYDQHCAKAP